MITVSGYDLKGRACTVQYRGIDIHHIEVGALSAVIYKSAHNVDIAISLHEFRRIQPLLHKKTKITGEYHE